MKGSFRRELREFVADVNPALSHAHAEHVFARKIGNKDVILRQVLLVLADRDNFRRFASYQGFDAVIGDGGDGRLRRARDQAELRNHEPE